MLMHKIISSMYRTRMVYHCPLEWMCFIPIIVYFFVIFQNIFYGLGVAALLYVFGVAAGLKDPDFFSLFLVRFNLGFTAPFIIKKNYQATGSAKATTKESMTPLIGISPDGITQLKDGNIARVIEFSGKDYTGIPDDLEEYLSKKRQMLFDNTSNNLVFMFQTHRLKEDFENQEHKFSVEIAKEIAKKRSANFQKAYITKHFLIITPAKNPIQTLIKNLTQSFGTKASNNALALKVERLLNETTTKIINDFKEFGAHELKGDQLISYYNFLLNHKKITLKMPKSGIFNDLLEGSDVKFLKKHQIYDGVKTVYSGWFSIKKPDEFIGINFVSDICQAQIDFSIYQNFFPISKEKGLKAVSDKLNNALSFIKNADYITQELDELKSQLQADNLSLIGHTFAVEVFGKSTEDLEENMSVLESRMQSFGFQFTRENTNKECLFWSRLPGHQDLNIRKKNITSANAASFIPLSRSGEGFNTCRWGSGSVAAFPTSDNTPYQFIFHEDESDSSLGNTLVVGGTGLGKTTLISFLISQCFKYENFKAICFDRMQGMKIFTDTHKGIYINEETLRRKGFNPLLLPYSEANRIFVNNWLELLLNIKTDEDKAELANATRILFDQKKEDKTTSFFLKDLAATQLGLGGAGSIRNRLEKWLPNGNYGGFFNASKDSMDLNNPLTSFDMSNILNNQEIVAPMVSYIFHKLFNLIDESEENHSIAIFTDELNRYIESPLFASMVSFLLEEIRKRNGIFIGAVQTPNRILDDQIATKFLTNIATMIFFPDARAIDYYYMDVPTPEGGKKPNFNLTQPEFDFIKKPNNRQILVKKRSGESIILNTDLTNIGKYLRCFNSEQGQIKKLASIQKKQPNYNEWIRQFLKQ